MKCELGERGCFIYVLCGRFEVLKIPCYFIEKVDYLERSGSSVISGSQEEVNDTDDSLTNIQLSEL